MRKISASGVRAFSSCQSAWGRYYLLGQKRGTTPAQALGHAVEAQIVAYLSGAVSELAPRGLDPATREGEIALAGLEHLPSPSAFAAMGGSFQEHLTGRIEAPCGLCSSCLLAQPRCSVAEPLTFHGYADLTWIDYGADLATSVVCVRDIKTTSDLAWGMRDDEFSSDPQRIIYTYALAQFYGLPVDSAWLYLETAGTGVSKTTHRVRVLQAPLVYPDAAADDMAQLIQSGLDITAVGGIELPEDEDETLSAAELAHNAAIFATLPRNLMSCFAYRGCQYADACVVGQVPAWQRLAGLVRQRLISEARKKALPSSAV